MSTYRIKGLDGVVIESQKFLELPKAPTKITTEVQRPGMLRYNNEWQAFEGALPFTDGSVDYRRFVHLDENGRLLTSQLPDSVTSGLQYIGTFSPITDDVDPPADGNYTNLPKADINNSGWYFIVRGIYDAAVAHYLANKPAQSPATFTPVNPSGKGNWLEIKYYFVPDPYDATRVTVTAAFGRIIEANVPAGQLGLVDLSLNPALTDAFDANNNPASENGLSDTDWVISDSTKWTHHRQSRASVLATHVLFDKTSLTSSRRALPDSPTGTVQNVTDSLLQFAVRRTGDAMLASGAQGDGRLAFVYGTATAPGITFNNKPFDPLTNPGTDPSKWSDGTTGIYHPNVAGTIAVTSSGTERLRITPTQVLFNIPASGTATIPSIVFSGTGNTNLGLLTLNNKTQLVSNNAVQVSFEQGQSNFYGSINVNANTILGDATTDTLVVNATSTFNADLATKANTVIGDAAVDTLIVNATSTFNADLATKANTVIGDAAADTLIVNATSTFNAPVQTQALGVTNLTVSGNTILGDAASDTLVVNAGSTFKAPSTFNADVNTADLYTNGSLVVKGNTVLGDAYNTDTLSVNARASFYGNTSFGELNNPKAVGQVFYSGSQFIGNTSYTNNSSATYSLGSELRFQNGTPYIVSVGYNAAGVMYFKSKGTDAEYDFSFDDPNTNSDTIRLTRNGIKLPVLETNDNSVGTDGMVAFSSSQNTVMQKVQGTWKPVGSGATIVPVLQANWTLNGNFYDFTTTQAGVKSVQVMEGSGSTYTQIEVDSIIVTDTNVTIKIPANPDLRFTGRLILLF